MSTPQFRFFTLAELEQEPPAVDLWEGVLPEDGLAVLYAQSGIGKTFFSVRVMLSVSEGIPLHGRRVRPGPVVVVLMEGGGRWHRRLRAACNALSVEYPKQIYVCRDPLYPHALVSVTAFIAAVREHLGGQPVALTVIDTLARASAGSDESKTADRELTIDGLRSIQRHAGGAILAVHHTGWNDSRMRGGYNLQAACDTVLRLEAGEADRSLVLIAEKIRDGEDGFKLAGVLTSHCDSLVYDAAELVEAVEAIPPRLPPKVIRAMEALHSVALAEGATSKEWRTSTKLSESEFYRIRKQLVEWKAVTLKGRQYSLSDSGLGLLPMLPRKFQGTSKCGDTLLPSTSTPCRGGRLEVSGSGNGRQGEIAVARPPNVAESEPAA